jgi:hypothetical protein
MSKMGLHCSFEHLKHKLWPKEGPGVELPAVRQFWLPTIKSQESTRSTWLQTTCHIPLESSRRELQLCFRPHCDRSSAQEVMRPQSPGSPSWRDSGSPAGLPGEKSHLDAGLMERHIVYYKGEGGGFPKFEPCWVKWIQGCPWLVLAPKVLQLCTNHFVRVLCKPVWVSETYQLFLVPSRSSNPPLYPSKGCELGSVPQLLLLPLFSYLGPHLGPLRSWECVTWYSKLGESSIHLFESPYGT